ncbi:sensor histidine kinase [Pelagicoccus sp. SDUM812002]|uniref:sensor histidine kinase n=1 Tax=Pelagicoccus sp. SDUM812002 TaxID=3041266 RepID=UPI002810577A|nr:sensor histidine kinase [Pelagicoccus sp. SDUM812002]MDQ8185648.1 sensor histidine kinase [Pelagicoccus sp. SDUM812002]
MVENGIGQRESEEEGAGAEANRVERNNNNIFAIFGSILMLMALILPFAYAEKTPSWGLSVLQVLLWAVFCAAWLRQGFLVEKAGVGFDVRDSALKPEIPSRIEETLLYLLVFGPSCFAYIYVAHVNTSYFGFNYVLMFVVAGFATLLFPLWLATLYLVYQCVAWVLVGRLMWGGWMELDDIVNMIAGYFFSAMMFYIFRRERKSRSRAFALSVELNNANEKLRAFSRQVEELAATQERNRIAREIHDTIGHSLTVVNMQLETAKALLVSDKEKAGAFLEKAQEVTKKGLADVRSSVASLRSSPLDGSALDRALETLLSDSFGTEVAVSFELEEGFSSIPVLVESALYRSAQEALTNVRKHAEASKVSVSLDLSGQGIVSLEVKDNGKGCSVVSGGFGIMGIRERIQLLDGKVSFNTSPGNGFCLSISVPR